MTNRILQTVLSIIVVLTLGQTTSFAQQQTGTIQGTITDAQTSEVLPGANVFIEKLSRGTATNADGEYAIKNIPFGKYQVRFSYIGYETMTIPVEVNEETVTVNAELKSSVRGLEDVVVTALGIERQERSLGYSVQELETEELTQTPEPNFVDLLQGQAAGVTINSSNAMGGSSRIVLRGAKSISGNNQPLFVINGVPIENSGFNNVENPNFTEVNQATGSGGYDYGNAAQIVNPNDVASVSILKGPSAAALYGSRAANGVIQITTRGGGDAQGLGVSFSTGVTTEQVYGLPDYQNEYGGGASNPFSMNAQGQLVADFATDESWGPPLDGRPVRQWYSYDEVNGLFGEATPWEAQSDNVKDFFNTGINHTTNLSFARGTENYTFRLSLKNMRQDGIFPNSSLDRNQVGFNGSLNVTDELTASFFANYNYSDAIGRPGTGYDNENVFLQFNQFGQRQVDLGEGSYMRNYIRPEAPPSASQRGWNWRDPVAGTFQFTDNPYWVRFQNYQNDDTERLFGKFALSYDITGNLNVTANAGTDYFLERRQERVAVGSQALPLYQEGIREVQESNAEIRFNFNSDLTEDFSLNAIAGGNIRWNDFSENVGRTEGGLSTPGVYTLENSVARPSIGDYFQEKQVQSIYGSASLGFRDILYLDGTLRNDWSSTLPEDNNSFLYPSATVSFIFSDLEPFADTNVLSFGKLRAGWAQVGNDTDPYQLALDYSPITPIRGNPQLSVPGTIPNPELRPETTTSWEAGADLWFFNNRLGLDVTWYNDVTTDQILAVEISRASGYSFQLVNAGEITNEGWEVFLRGTPVLTSTGFQWEFAINWATNTSEVVELAEGLDVFTLGNAPFGVSVVAAEGMPYGTLLGTDFVYDDNGNKILNENGTYQMTPGPVSLGSYQPDWTGGISNTFSYRGFSASVLIDGQKGGDVYSITNLFGLYSGIMQETVEGDIRAVGLIPEGVTADGEPFNQVVDPEFYFKTLFGVKGAHVFDASYIKLRQIRLGYTLPANMLENLPLRRVTISAVGRNLATLFKNTPNFDPETALSTTNVQGIEVGSIPPSRTYGLNVQLDF